jgi:hypothetical protein
MANHGTAGSEVGGVAGDDGVGLGGIDVISNPSQAELLQKKFIEKKAVVTDLKKKAIYEKYLGNDAITEEGKIKHPKTLDPRLALGQTEVALTYTKDGRVAKDPSSFTSTAPGKKFLPFFAFS